MWTPLTFRTRLVGRDAKFLFVRHVLYARDVPAAEIACRLVTTEKRRIAPTDEVMAELGAPDWNPPLPDWMRKWAAADDARPWPPAD